MKLFGLPDWILIVTSMQGASTFTCETLALNGSCTWSSWLPGGAGANSLSKWMSTRDEYLELVFLVMPFGFPYLIGFPVGGPLGTETSWEHRQHILSISDGLWHMSMPIGAAGTRWMMITRNLWRHVPNSFVRPSQPLVNLHQRTVWLHRVLVDPKWSL